MHALDILDLSIHGVFRCAPRFPFLKTSLTLFFTGAEDDYLVLPHLPSLQVFRHHTRVPLLCAPESMNEHQADFASFRLGIS